MHAKRSLREMHVEVGKKNVKTKKLFVCKMFDVMFCPPQTSLPSNLLSFLLTHLAQYFALYRVVFIFP